MRRMLALLLVLAAVAVAESGPVAAAPPPAATFHGLTPARLADTRASGQTIDGQVRGVGPLGPGAVLNVPLLGRGGVPAFGVGSVALNVTAINPTAASFLTVYPTGSARPNASNLNLSAGVTLPNMVIVPVGAGGQVTLYNDQGSTNVAVDVLGWYPPQFTFQGLTPARLADTRASGQTIDGQVRNTGALAAGATLNVPVAGRGGVPATGAAAVALNVTAINPTAASFVTVYPTGSSRPNASNLNLAAGRTLPNMVIVPLGTGGAITLYNDQGATNLAVDVLGWFPPGDHFTGLTPARLADTRASGQTVDGLFRNTGLLGPAGVLSIQVTGRGGVQGYGVGAVVLNVTAINPTAASFLTVYPAGATRPNASNLNLAAGRTLPNMVIVPVGNGGFINIYNDQGSTNVAVDVLGWSPHTSYTPYTQRVNLRSDGTPTATFGSLNPSISADGRFVAFESQSPDLVLDDTNNVSDIFVHDRQLGTTIRVSTRPGGVQATGASMNPSISADGRWVAFESADTNLVANDTNNQIDVFVHDLLTSTTGRVSVTADGTQGDAASQRPSISGNGRYVAFESGADNLVADGNGFVDIFVKDRLTSSLTRVNVSTAGAASNGASTNAAISANGRYVAFESGANNLVAGDGNGSFDVFVRDLQTNTTTRVSVATGGLQALNGNSTEPSVSADGRYVAFTSAANNLVGGDGNSATDVFVHDRETNTTTLMSRSTAGQLGNSASRTPSISGDGRYVAFASVATNLLATPDALAHEDIFVHDRITQETERLSVSVAGAEGNGNSANPATSGDGRAVAFDSVANNLIVNDANIQRDVFVRDRGTSTPFS